MNKIGFICFTILLFTCNPIATVQASLANDRYTDGQAYLKQGNYKGAVAAFTHCIAELENAAPGYGCFAGRADAQNNLGNYDAAIQDATEGIKRYTKGAYAKGYYIRGYAYRSTKEYDKAISDLQRALPEAQHSNKGLLKSIYRELGRSYYEKAEYVQSISYLQKAMEQDATSPSTYWWLGRAYEKNGDREKAIEAYENYLRYAKPTGSHVAAAKIRIEKLSKP